MKHYPSQKVPVKIQLPPNVYHNEARHLRGLVEVRRGKSVVAEFCGIFIAAFFVGGAVCSYLTYLCIHR